MSDLRLLRQERAAVSGAHPRGQRPLHPAPELSTPTPAALCPVPRTHGLPAWASPDPAFHPPASSSQVKASSLPSDLSFDNSDLVMLKSLLAGLSLPSRDDRTDRGLDEEGEGEWGWQGLLEAAVEQSWGPGFPGRTASPGPSEAS